MSKKLINLLVILAVFVFTVIPTSLISVTAVTYNESGTEDNFDGTSLDSTKWNVINNAGGEISQYVMPGTLKMLKMPAGTSIVTKEKVGTDGKGLIIEFDLIAYENAGLIRILKGMNAQTPSTEDMNDSYLQNAGDVRSTRGDWKPFARYNHSSGWLEANAWGSVGFSQVGSRYQFVFNNDGSFTLNTKAIGADDSTYVKQIETTTADVENQWANAKFTKTGSGYAGFYFESANGSLVIDNVNIRAKDDSSVFTDDFEYFNLDTEKWTASEGIIGGFGKSLRIYNLDGNGLGKVTSAQLLSKTNIVNLSTKNDVAAQISFKIKANQLKAASAGITFGLADDTGYSESTKRFSVSFKENGGKLYLSAAKDGALYGTDLELGALSAFADYSLVKLVITNNGINQTLAVYVKGSLVKTYALQKLSGFIAFSGTAGTYTHIVTPEVPAVADDPLTTEIDESSPLIPAVTETRNGLINFEIDDFKVSYTKYAVAEGKDLINKFDSADLGTDWYLTSRGLGGLGGENKDPLPEGWGVNIKDGKLVFNNASDGSYFGPNKKYGNFDLSFDVSDIGYADIMDDDDNYVMMKSQFLGITFGRDELDTMYHGGNGFANTLFLDHNPWGGTDNTAAGADLGRLYLAQGNAGNLTDFVYNFANPWTKENQERGALTVRVRVVDGTLNVYLRYADEPASKLDKPVLTAQIDSRIGYVALTCTEPTYYSIDNFSIKNIDQTGVVEDIVTPCPNPDDHDNVCPNPDDHDNVCPDPSAHNDDKPKGCGGSAAVGVPLVLALGAMLFVKKNK